MSDRPTGGVDEQAGAGRGGWAVWSAGFVVVVAAGAATAHGLYVVALGSGTPPGIAWLYPVITDGLALVAYAATTRLAGPGRRYAWSVVVLAAGLSGLAQATYLAGALPSAADVGAVATAPPVLRFGVGAWPAVAAAIAAHLLFLIGTHQRPGPAGVVDAEVSTPRGGDGWDAAADPAVPSRLSSDGTGQRPNPEPVPTVPGQLALSVTDPSPTAGLVGSGGRSAVSQAERAREVARRHARRTGALPTVRELAELAEVGRGTADRALAALRATAEPPRTGAVPAVNGHRAPGAGPHPRPLPAHEPDRSGERTEGTPNSEHRRRPHTPHEHQTSTHQQLTESSHTSNRPQ